MGTTTALALVVASAPAAYAAGPALNELFIDQIGTRNDATISQKNGNNAQATFQAGKNNSVITDQVSKLAGGKNTSANIEIGKGNSASTNRPTRRRIRILRPRPSPTTRSARSLEQQRCRRQPEGRPE